VKIPGWANPTPTLVIVIILFVIQFAYADNSLNELFPPLSDMPGGSEHWMGNILPVEEMNGCEVYSATYAYFAKESKPLFDIPRKNVYSANIRFHLCPNMAVASAVYDKFSEVGDKERKKLMPIGDKGTLYVVPAPQSELMGDYYLTSLFKYIVMQVHADDGFVLMDIAEKMADRLNARIDNVNGITLNISKDGYRSSSKLITLPTEGVGTINLSGVIYDQENRRVQNATIDVPETGAKSFSSNRGEFAFKVGRGKGKEIDIFRVLELDRVATSTSQSIESGYYKVLFEYPDGSTTQDIWKLSVAPDGKLSGSTLNTKNDTILFISGKLDGDNLTIDRPCGSSIFGGCLQQFKGELHGDIVEGAWSGSGGGGIWKLYKDSFKPKEIELTIREADLRFMPKSTDGVRTLSPKNNVEIYPIVKKHSDFLFISSKLLVDITADSQAKGRDYMLSIFGVDNKTERMVSTSHMIPVSKGEITAELDITNIYRSAIYPKYLLKLDSRDNISAKISTRVGVTFAVEQSLANADGAVRVELVPEIKRDVASNVKAIKADGKDDLCIALELKAFGGTLQGVSITATGKEQRRWNSSLGNIYPGVAVADSSDKTLNNDDGTITYPIEQMEETLYLYIDKGSLDMANVEGFNVDLMIDGVEVKNVIQ
jgi:hypothetical protein